MVEGINSAILRAREMKEKSKEEGEKRLTVLEECKEKLENVVQRLENIK